MVRVAHDGADIVEHSAKDLLKMFGPFFEVVGVDDVKDALRLNTAGVRSGMCVPPGRRTRGECLRRSVVDEDRLVPQITAEPCAA